MLILVALCLPFQEIKFEQEKVDVLKPVQSRLLNQDAIDEIKKIRDRVGIKLFSDQKSGKAFEKELQKLNKNGSRPSQVVRPLVLNPGIAKAPRVQSLPPNVGLNPNLPVEIKGNIGVPYVEPIAKNARLTRPAPKRVTYADTLFQTVANLDQAALELEKQGEFEKSERLRKLSRKIRKQIRDIVNPRDN